MRSRLGWCVVALTALLALPASAAAQARSDFSFGYSNLDLFGQDGSSSLDLPAGFFASVGGRIGRGVMAVGEVADSTKSVNDFGVSATASVFTYAGGLRFVSTERYGRGRREAARPFVEILVGGAHLSAGVAGETVVTGDALAVMPGAGVDVPIAPRIALRLAGRYEWYHSGGSASAFRVDVGLTFRTGRR